MKINKLNLAQLRVTSFVTSVAAKQQQTVKGGFEVSSETTWVSVKICDTENTCHSINGPCATEECDE